MSSQRAQDLTRLLGELQQLERELLEHRYVRQSDGTERVREALRRLGEIGSPAGIIAKSAEELGLTSEFDLVLVSRVDNGKMLPQALWSRQGLAHADRTLTKLKDRSIALRYPLIEAEVAQHHRATLVSVREIGRRAAPDLVGIVEWRSYAVADIRLEGSAAGLLHAGRTGGIDVDEIDLELAMLYAEGLAQVFERAMLRELLQRQRAQLSSAADWINAQIADLALQVAPAATASVARDDRALADLLSPREFEVMELIAQGRSNRAIATSLLLGEGTVKYHVKNILRKLQARSRTEAISRYVRLRGTANRDGQ